MDGEVRAEAIASLEPYISGAFIEELIGPMVVLLVDALAAGHRPIVVYGLMNLATV